MYNQTHHRFTARQDRYAEACRTFIANPDSKHWENTAKETVRLVRRLVDTREMQKALEMMSPDWFERQTWQAAAEGWQRVLAAATKPLDAVTICELLAAAPQSEAIPF